MGIDSEPDCLSNSILLCYQLVTGFSLQDRFQLPAFFLGPAHFKPGRNIYSFLPELESFKDATCKLFAIRVKYCSVLLRDMCLVNPEICGFQDFFVTLSLHTLTTYTHVHGKAKRNNR